MLHRGIFIVASQSRITHEFETIGELIGTVEREPPPLYGCNAVGRPNEEFPSFCLEEFTADVVAHYFRITDTATGRTWQGNFMFVHGGSKLRLVSAGEVLET